MFNRKQYKNFALKQIKGRWFVPILMTFIISAISFLFDLPSTLKLLTNDALLNYTGTDLNELLLLYNSTLESSHSRLTTIITLIVNAILQIAALNVYLKMSRSPEPVSFKNFIEGLNNWARAILAALWQFLWVFLWSLLFIIPGFIKAIAYSQTYRILAEYEDISVTKAMRISIIITKGHKWDLVVLHLSFLGWIILSALTLGLGVLWLEPYYQLTFVNAYHGMLKEALSDGRLKPEDLTE